MLFNTERGEYFTLDRVGTETWKILTTSSSMAEAHDTLLNQYDVTSDQLKDDLTLLVGDLEARGLIEMRRVPS